MKPTVKLLIVDDVAANLLALEQLIEAHDRQIIRAKSGEEALEILLKDQDFAVILMDVQMPGLDGFDTVNLLKAKSNCQEIPIIFLTAFDREGSMEINAYDHGAVDYVMKPIQPQILSSKVNIFVELYKNRLELMKKNTALEQANITLIREISLRERAEAQLRLADQAIHDTHESVIITDAQGIIQRTNPAFCTISGFNHHELNDINIKDLICNSSSQAEYDIIFATLQGHGDWVGKLNFQHKNGATFSTWVHLSGIYNKQQTLTHFCAILSEIDDPQKIEIALRKVKSRLEQAQHISHLGGWEWNLSDSEIYFSDELFHILNTRAGQVSPSIAMCQQFIHPDDQHKLDQIIASAQAGQSSDSVLRLRLPNGNERIIHQQTEARCNTKGKLVQLIGTVHDITEHAKLEEKFMQAQKMEAVGALVGGIAHEFNNILAGMNGHMYLAKSNVENSKHVHKHINQLELLSSRAAETIQQMLTFSRKGVVTMGETCLNTLISETLKLHQSSVPENIALDYAICDDALTINGDITMIQQVILNLIINARDALSGTTAPTILVSLQRIDTDATFLSKHADAQHGAYAELTVSDNGCGIDPDNADKIFEPFFTSKGNDGTGLGLSMVYGAVKSHQGFIQLESQLEKGSAFHIYLPLLNPQETHQETTTEKQLVNGHGETILIADDEEIVREMTHDTLEVLGYNVITANDGQQALEIFSQRKDEIKLVILDVIMPKRSGIDTASAIRTIQPDTAIVFITGYTEDSSQGNEIADDETIIMKPFTIHEFSQHIANALP